MSVGTTTTCLEVQGATLRQSKGSHVHTLGMEYREASACDVLDAKS